MTERPTTVEPVKATLFTSGCSAMAAPAPPLARQDVEDARRAPASEADPAELERGQRAISRFQDDGVSAASAAEPLQVERKFQDDHPDDPHRPRTYEGLFGSANPRRLPDEAPIEPPRVPAGGQIDEAASGGLLPIFDRARSPHGLDQRDPQVSGALRARGRAGKAERAARTARSTPSAGRATSTMV
jgi:hypothetical protein